jgi:hypothetical protein
MALKTTRFKPDENVTAMQSFATQTQFVQIGTVFKASHPTVQAWPDYFISSSVPPTEWPPQWIDVPNPEPEARGAPGSTWIKPAPSPEEICFCTTAFRVGRRQFRIGDAYRMTDETVAANAIYFERRIPLNVYLEQQGS